MPVSLLAGVLVVCAGACHDDELLSPSRLHRPPHAVVTADSACSVMTFSITSPTHVDVSFPERDGCTSGLVHISVEDSRWWEGPDRKLRVWLRLLNTSGQALQLPIHLTLCSTGISVIAPAGQPATRIIPLNADSVDGTTSYTWFVGGTGTLAAGDSTPGQGLDFTVLEPVTQGEFQFLTSVASTDTMPLQVPPNWSAPHDSTRTFSRGGTRTELIFREYYGLSFKSSATDQEIRDLLSRYHGTIVGGIPGPRGTHVVQVPDPVTVAAVDSLLTAFDAEPIIYRAYEMFYRVEYDARGRFPVDGGPSSVVTVSDTLPTVPNTLAVPDDSLETIQDAGDTTVTFFRTMASIWLKSGTTGAQFAAFLQKYNATIVGGIPFTQGYIIRFPDPGPTWADYMTRMRALKAEPIVRFLTPQSRWEGVPKVNGRFPTAPIQGKLPQHDQVPRN